MAGWIGTIYEGRSEVHPAHRERGLEDSLLDWLETRGAERLRAIAAERPNNIGALGLYERLGFVAYRRTIVFDKEIDP